MDGRSRIHSKVKFFTGREVIRSNTLLSEAAHVPSLEVFKTRLDGAWWMLF